MKPTDYLSQPLQVGDVVVISEWDMTLTTGVIVKFTSCGLYLTYVFWNDQHLGNDIEDMEPLDFKMKIADPPKRCYLYKSNEKWDTPVRDSSIAWQPGSISRRLLKIHPSTLGTAFAEKHKKCTDILNNNNEINTITL